MKQTVTRCEDCMYFDYDEEYESEVCKMDLDEDEMEKYMISNRAVCPFFRFYDEYKSVQKQN